MAVVALDAYAADKLLFLNDARLIAVWVTLNTIDQLRDRYKCVGVCLRWLVLISLCVCVPWSVGVCGCGRHSL